MPKYKLRESAREDLKEIAKYTKNRWGVKQCNKYLQSFDKRFSWLAENPRFGKTRDEVKPGYFSYSEGSHVIFYIINKDSVNILGILHESMVPEFHL